MGLAWLGHGFPITPTHRKLQRVEHRVARCKGSELVHFLLNILENDLFFLGGGSAESSGVSVGGLG